MQGTLVVFSGITMGGVQKQTQMGKRRSMGMMEPWEDLGDNTRCMWDYDKVRAWREGTTWSFTNPSRSSRRTGTLARSAS